MCFEHESSVRRFVVCVKFLCASPLTGFFTPHLGLFLWGLKMPKFKVLREHDGDKFYFPGDVRTANAADVAHLVANGVLKPLADAPETKLAPAHENKADKPAKVK